MRTQLKISIASLLFNFSFLIFNFSFSQSITFEKWYDYGFAEQGRSVQQTNDGGYIIAGFQGIVPNYVNILLVKTDSLGQVIWDKFIGANGAERIAYGVRQTNDGGYIIIGERNKSIPSDHDVYLVKTDSNGDTLWTKTYGNSGTNQWDVGRSVRQTFDGGYIICGYQDTLALLIKINSMGDTLWTKKFDPDTSSYSSFISVKQTSDSGYIAVGSIGAYNVYLVRTKSNGDTLWTKRYGDSVWQWFAYSLDITIDGGYILGGNIVNNPPGNSDVYIVKTNSNGDTLWTKTYGGTGTGYEDCRSIYNTSDEGYIIMGNTTGNAGDGDALLLKLNSTGQMLWQRSFGTTTESEYGYYGYPTADGGYVIAGTSDSVVCVYLVKTDSAGLVLTAINEIDFATQKMSVYPNPFSALAVLVLSNKAKVIKNKSLSIYNLLGNEISKANIPDGINIFQIEKNSLSSGMYLFKVFSNTQILGTGNFIIQ